MRILWNYWLNKLLKYLKKFSFKKWVIIWRIYLKAILENVRIIEPKLNVLKIGFNILKKSFEMISRI
jgi:hypothetical protein